MAVADKPVPGHHKAIARHLFDRFPPPAKVFVYRDNQGKCPVPIAHLGPAASRFYSTIGISDLRLPVPAGRFELAAVGKMAWLPNAAYGSISWLKGRRVKEWPLVCEDVVRHNAKSTYRHMAYIPSEYSFRPAAKGAVRWLLGLPITDREICVDRDEVTARVMKVYPAWLTLGLS